MRVRYKDTFMKHLTYCGFLLNVLMLSGCETPQTRYVLEEDQTPSFKLNIAKIQNAIPRDEPLSRTGNPAYYTVSGKRYKVLKNAQGYGIKRGIASYYGMKFHTYQTSSGEAYDVFKMTAAHKTLPLPTYVRVTNLNNKKQVIVKINDRGPFAGNRILDLSYAAAAKLDMLKTGIAPVEIEVIIPKKRIHLSRFMGFSKNKPSTRVIRPKTWLHINSFLIKHNAEQNAQYIRRLTQRNATIKLYSSGYFTFYRIIIGPFENAAQAQPTQKKLNLKGYRNIVVKTT